MLGSNLALASGSRAELTANLQDSMQRQGQQAMQAIDESLRPTVDAGQELELLRAQLAGYAWARPSDEKVTENGDDAVAQALSLTGVTDLGREIDEKIDVQIEHAGHIASALTWTFGLGILRTGLKR